MTFIRSKALDGKNDLAMQYTGKQTAFVWSITNLLSFPDLI